MVQMAVAEILSAIYENDFLDVSFGFRPGRGCHDALKTLNWILVSKRTNYVVDADIRGFFDTVDHDWMMRFLEHRIADSRLLGLIRRFLIAGVMEEGQLLASEQGTPQGGIISPILANIYLHYVLDLWFERVVRDCCRGEAYLVRYCDDFVCCFQYKDDAERFYNSLVRRLSRFGLTVAEEKTKIIAFGRFAEQWGKRNNTGKPETFDFLGFTHYCSHSRQGKFRVKRLTSRKKLNSSMKRITQWIKQHRHDPLPLLLGELAVKLRGHYQYYGVTDNVPRLQIVYRHVRKTLLKWLNRRSQRKSLTGEQYERLLAHFPLPTPKIYVNIMQGVRKVA